MSIRFISLQPDSPERTPSEEQEKYIRNILEYRGITDSTLYHSANIGASRVKFFNSEQEYKEGKAPLAIFSWWRPEYKCYGDVE
jgi:hypothetical protein